MSIEVLSSLILVALFVIATVWGIQMGALAIVAAFIVGVLIQGMEADDVAAGFPGDLFIILAGVTFLFAIARNNGTIDWLIQASVRAVAGRVSLIPWVFFAITGLLTAMGAVVPAAVAIIAPVGMGFAVRYGINPLLMGLMVVNGATAGGFSPISIFGSITNGVVERNDLAGSPIFLFLASLVFNVILGIITFVLFGGRDLVGVRDTGGGVLVRSDGTRHGGPDDGGHSDRWGGGTRTGVSAAEQTGTSTVVDRQREPGGTTDTASDLTLNPIRILTLMGITVVGLGAFFELDPGFTAFSAAVALSVIDREGTRGAVNQIAWPTVLLVCGIVTYVSLLEELGTVDYLGDQVAAMGAALFAAILILYIGGVVSAFASTTGILGALIPLAVPFLEGGEIGAIGLITALAISSSVVDSSPFSTSGSLVVANAPEDQRDLIFRRLMQWGFTMVAVAPPVTWLILVAPGWL
jgi:di/tricarboxylate transporter